MTVEHLIKKLEGNSTPIPFSGCMVWLGAMSSTGYGVMYLGGGRKAAVLEGVHRVAYRLLCGPIPDGLEPDHLCRVKLCWNTEHLELVTRGENIRRGPAHENQTIKRRAIAAARTHCSKGHKLIADNIYVQPGTHHRLCMICKRARYNAWYARKGATR